MRTGTLANLPGTIIRRQSQSVSRESAEIHYTKEISNFKTRKTSRKDSIHPQSFQVKLVLFNAPDWVFESSKTPHNTNVSFLRRSSLSKTFEIDLFLGATAFLQKTSFNLSLLAGTAQKNRPIWAAIWALTTLASSKRGTKSGSFASLQSSFAICSPFIANYQPGKRKLANQHPTGPSTDGYLKMFTVMSGSSLQNNPPFNPPCHMLHNSETHTPKVLIYGMHLQFAFIIFLEI